MVISIFFELVISLLYSEEESNTRLELEPSAEIVVVVSFAGYCEVHDVGKYGLHCHKVTVFTIGHLEPIFIFSVLFFWTEI